MTGMPPFWRWLGPSTKNSATILVMSHSLRLWNAWSPWTLTDTAARRACTMNWPESLDSRIPWEIVLKSTFGPATRSFAASRTTLGPRSKTLRRRSLKTGVITNGPSYWQSLKIEAMGIAPLFDTVLISENEGFGKPDARIFSRAVERCGVTASESMFVGDHPEADILGAKAAGLVPVWKRMDYWNVPDEVQRIERISEILPLIG